jgi:uncharacterized coiled-coil protein SlyX
MKTRLFFLIAGIFISGGIQAQVHLFLQEQDIELKDTRSSGWVFPIAQGFDEAFNDLQQYCRDRSDVRMRKDGDQLYVADKVSMPVIASKRGDLIGFGFATESYNAMAIVFQLGYDISVNRGEWPMEMSNLRNFAKEFMSYHYEQSYARRIDELEKSVKAFERDIDQNERKIGNMEGKIENTRRKIEKETDPAKVTDMENEIATLESDIEELSNALPGLRNDVENMKSNIEKLRNESMTFQNAIASV